MAPDDDKAERMRANVLVAINTTDWVLQKTMKEYQARHMKQKYDAAIRQGFTEANALYLCTQSWPIG